MLGPSLDQREAYHYGKTCVAMIGCEICVLVLLVLASIVTYLFALIDS